MHHYKRNGGQEPTQNNTQTYKSSVKYISLACYIVNVFKQGPDVEQHSSLAYG